MPNKTPKGKPTATPVAWEDVEKPSYDIASLREQFRKRLVKDNGGTIPVQNGVATRKRPNRKP